MDIRKDSNRLISVRNLELFLLDVIYVIHTCQHCNIEYEALREESKFCSRACYHITQKIRRITKICKQCEKEYKAKANNGQFCSNKCWKTHRIINGPTVICELCSIAFRVENKRREKEARFCSMTCMGKMMSIERKRPIETLDHRQKRIRLLEEGTVKSRYWFKTEARKGFQYCTTCLEEKLLSEFQIRIERNTLYSECRLCRRDRGRRNTGAIPRKSKQEQAEIRRLSARNLRYRRRSWLKTGNITLEEWIGIVAQYDYKCAYCSMNITAKQTTMDHIIPLSKRGLHCIENVVPACKSCNSSKGDREKPSEYIIQRNRGKLNDSFTGQNCIDG